MSRNYTRQRRAANRNAVSSRGGSKATPPTFQLKESGSGIGKGKITASALNVRGGAGARHGKVGSALPRGTEITIYAERNGWFKIGPGQWVSGKFVERTDGNKIIAKGSVTASSLNVRSGAGTSFGKVGKPLKNGASVNVYEENKGWYRIGDNQWVSARYINTGGRTSGGQTPQAPKKEERQSSGGRRQSGGGTGSKPNWLRIAEGELGVKEIKGSKHNERVIEYHSTTGKFTTDEVPWCASFVNWVMNKAGKGGTGSARAMSWKNYGKNVKKPAYGSIAVFSYGGGKGHVGFVIGKQGDRLLVLGGNQSDQVKVSSFGTSKVVAYVVPGDYEVPDAAFSLGESNEEVEESTFAATR